MVEVVVILGDPTVYATNPDSELQSVSPVPEELGDPPEQAFSLKSIDAPLLMEDVPELNFST